MARAFLRERLAINALTITPARPLPMFANIMINEMPMAMPGAEMFGSFQGIPMAIGINAKAPKPAKKNTMRSTARSEVLREMI